MSELALTAGVRDKIVICSDVPSTEVTGFRSAHRFTGGGANGKLAINADLLNPHHFCHHSYLSDASHDRNVVDWTTSTKFTSDDDEVYPWGQQILFLL